MSYPPTPWQTSENAPYGWEVGTAENVPYKTFLAGLDKATAEHIVACANACADIPTEHLVSMNWQLAPKAGAKPVDVANLLLKLAAYRDALAKIAGMIGVGPGLPIFEDIMAVVKETLE